jgi:hypothetical protein
VYAFNYIRNLHTISCLQNTLIVYKQTSALHIINPRLKVANIRCFILIADEIFQEIRRCLILLHPVKHSSMFTRIIMILFIYSVTYTASNPRVFFIYLFYKNI